jgi:hypothetical protein
VIEKHKPGAAGSTRQYCRYRRIIRLSKLYSAIGDPGRMPQA